MTRTPNQHPARFGFRLERSSTHTSRTMMLAELRGVLSYVDRPEAGKVDYRRAIDDENCLGKWSSKTRLLTYRHLSDLYALDPSLLLFRSVTLAEIAVEKGATVLLMPVSCRRQLFDLSDDMATKIDLQFYADARDALLKAMVE